MKKILSVVIAVLCILTVSASFIRINKKECINNDYKDIRNFGIINFINLDLGFIGNFPTQKHWENIDEKIKKVPIDSLRYIDSLDIKHTADTLLVKVYTQNYLYQSKNTYKITPNPSKLNDTLIISNFTVDLKLKEEVDDARTFRKNDFTVNYETKHKIGNIEKRIIFNKKYR